MSLLAKLPKIARKQNLNGDFGENAPKNGIKIKGDDVRRVT